MAIITKMEKNPNTALIIPLKGHMEKKYCNDCSFCNKINTKEESSSLKNFMCEHSTKRVVRLKVYDGEKVDVPFWCPQKSENKNSMLDEEQQRKWEASRLKYEMEKKWKQIKGILDWDDIKPEFCYHYPPSPFHGRMNIQIEEMFPNSLRAVNLDTKRLVWLYKSDGSYKFMSRIKQRGNFKKS